MNRLLWSGLVVTCTLVACGSSTTAPGWFVREYLGGPSSLSPNAPNPTFTDTAVWGTSGQVDIVTFGSSGCPKLPIRLDATAPNMFTVTLSNGEPGGACTADLAPTTSVIRTPSNVEPTRPVDVTIVDNGTRTKVVLLPLPPSG